jgi:hypothetical protein
MTDVVRPSGTALDAAGDDAGIGLLAAGATLETAAPARSGLAGTGLANTGLANTGQDATETAPLAALTASWDRAFAGLGGLAAPEDDAMPQGPPPGRRPASHSRRRSRPGPSTPTRSAPASGLGGKHPGVARGLLMTPWFAAAAGSVVAASLWIYSPHPQLSFAIGNAPCKTSDCGSDVNPQSAGRLAIKSGQRVTQQQHKSAESPKGSTREPARTAASGLAFSYVVQPAADGHFWLTVTITGKRPIKDWQLAFVLPGAHIQSVHGAAWHPAGGDGGTASQFTGVPGPQHGGPPGGGSGQGNPGGYGNGGTDDTTVFFTVLASGKPVGPADCSFDGASCTFRALPSPSQGVR